MYKYKCDLCDAEYFGYTSRHFYTTKRLKNDHGLETIGDLANNFSVFKKCIGKLDCLIYEMLYKKKKGHAWTHNPYEQNYLFKFVTFYMHILRFIAFSFLTWKWLHGVFETLCKTSFAYFYY